MMKATRTVGDWVEAAICVLLAVAFMSFMAFMAWTCAR